MTVIPFYEHWRPRASYPRKQSASVIILPVVRIERGMWTPELQGAYDDGRVVIKRRRRRKQRRST